MKEQLRRRAERHGRGLEAEARDILCSAVAAGKPPPLRLGSKISGRFAGRRRVGRAIEIRYAMICGIARARRAAIAAANVRHFEGSGVAIVNPRDQS